MLALLPYLPGVNLKHLRASASLAVNTIKDLFKAYNDFRAPEKEVQNKKLTSNWDKYPPCVFIFLLFTYLFNENYWGDIG